MKTSTDRILTTHVGSLPRPEKLVDLLRLEDQGKKVNQETLNDSIGKAVDEVVALQVESGVDVVSDGEVGKMSYHIYAKHRLKGLGNADGKGVLGRKTPMDLQDFPEMNLERAGGGGTGLLRAVVCNGPVSHANRVPVDQDIGRMHAALSKAPAEEAFMNSVSPGCLMTYVPNQFYRKRDQYREALIDALRPEYEAIHAAGFILQLDCPDLAGCRHTDYQDWNNQEFILDAEKSIEALNAATESIPRDAMRLHICWLNYAGPHTHDFPIKKLFGVLNKARPSALLFEGANARHEHEWEDWKDAKIDDDKILVPGVIDSTSNFVEHPRLVAQRICRYAEIVGRERVMAGTDCGFSTYAGRKAVYPSVVWAKLGALAEGAALASERLWQY